MKIPSEWSRLQGESGPPEPQSIGWTRIATQTLHEGRFLTLCNDTVVRPDGSQGTYEHVAVNDSVRVVALTDENQVVLVEDHFYLQGPRVLHLPGGGCGGQEPEVAARRELEEETGLVPEAMVPLAVIDPLPGMTAARTHLYVARGLTPGTVSRDDTEAGMTVMRWPLDTAVAAVYNGVITEAGSVAALLLTHCSQSQHQSTT